MKSVRSPLVKVPTKAPTRITGFDEITGGGLPRGRTTLLVGGPGSGKTILALQFLVHGAQDCFLRREPIAVRKQLDDAAMNPRKRALARFQRSLDWMQGAAIAAFVLSVSALALGG